MWLWAGSFSGSVSDPCQSGGGAKQGTPTKSSTYAFAQLTLLRSYPPPLWDTDVGR